MKCPKCGASMMSRVYGSKEEENTVKRHRECVVCNHRYVTVEQVIGVPGRKR